MLSRIRLQSISSTSSCLGDSIHCWTRSNFLQHWELGRITWGQCSAQGLAVHSVTSAKFYLRQSCSSEQHWHSAVRCLPWKLLCFLHWMQLTIVVHAYEISLHHSLFIFPSLISITAEIRFYTREVLCRCTSELFFSTRKKLILEFLFYCGSWWGERRGCEPSWSKKTVKITTVSGCWGLLLSV